MSDPTSVQSSVEVPVDPATAFTIFTEEIDCWWVQGPINFHDGTRTCYKRIEPDVGGRLLEVHDPRTGDGYELGRVTVWEPGARLAWTSSIDDIDVEVRFAPSAGGTRVEVEATIADGGADLGTTAWVRMSPQWLPTWIAKRDRAPHEPVRLARLGIAVHYDKAATAARWLRDVFGFESDGAFPDTDDLVPGETWIELHAGTSVVIVFPRGDAAAVESEDDPPLGITPWVFVDDLDAHHARVVEAGGRILTEIWHHGVRAYDAADCEGNRWTFAQASPIQRQLHL